MLVESFKRYSRKSLWKTQNCSTNRKNTSSSYVSVCPETTLSNISLTKDQRSTKSNSKTWFSRTLKSWAATNLQAMWSKNRLLYGEIASLMMFLPWRLKSIKSLDCTLSLRSSKMNTEIMLFRSYSTLAMKISRKECTDSWLRMFQGTSLSQTTQVNMSSRQLRSISSLQAIIAIKPRMMIKYSKRISWILNLKRVVKWKATTISIRDKRYSVIRKTSTS